MTTYAGPAHMYGTYVSNILIARGDFDPDWWQAVQHRVTAHLKMGTTPEQLADNFSYEWKVLRETGGWKGTGTPEPQQSEAMRQTLRYCAAAKRHGFA